MSEFVYPLGKSVDSVYGQTESELEELTRLCQAVESTKVYIGAANPHRHGAPEPHDGLSTDVVVNLDDWR